MEPSRHMWFLNAKQRLEDQNYKSLWVPDFTYGFCNQNSDFSNRIASLYGSQPSSVVFCFHNSDIMTRTNSLYGSQTSHVVLCMQNSVIIIRITSLYRSQPSSVVFAGKTVPFGSELQDSMGPRLRLLICACKTACLDQE